MLIKAHMVGAQQILVPFLQSRSSLVSFWKGGMTAPLICGAAWEPVERPARTRKAWLGEASASSLEEALLRSFGVSTTGPKVVESKILAGC